MKKEDREKLERTINPFTTQDFVRVREITVTNKMVNVNNIQDGIIVSSPSELKTKVLVEQENFTKVYTRMGYRLHISELNDNAKSLFLWIMYELDRGIDFIEFDNQQIKRYTTETGKSNVSFGKGLKDLIIASILTPTLVPKVYWVNPLFIFNGDRVKKYSERLIVE